MDHALSGNLVMIAELKIKPDRVEDFLAYTVPNLAVSRAQPGNLQFDMLLDETRPDTILFYEVWTSPEAQRAYMAWRIEAGDLTELMSYLAPEPRFTAWRSVAAPA